MKGIILAGGSGSRLYPITKVYNKQLVALYDKPMIYYPLNTLLSIGITEILVISSRDMLPLYEQLFGSGKQLGINIIYAVQDAPRGIAESFIIGENFIGRDNVCLILGDNIFYGACKCIKEVMDSHKATLFSKWVKNPQHYGVVCFEDGKPAKIVEKPSYFVSNFAVPGIYFYDSSVVAIAKSLSPSKRNELEITDINNVLFSQDRLDLVHFEESVTWLDCGNPRSLLEASNFIATNEHRNGKKIACIEETAYNMGYINKEQLYALARQMPKCEFSDYLLSI